MPCERPDRAAIASSGPTPGRLMPASVATHYAALVAAGKIERDAAQEPLVEKLARLENRLAEHRLARKSSSLGWVFGARAREREPIKGLYIFGDVGRGKTMLMDLFFAASPVIRKRDGFEAQEFKRTASRLIEMRSHAYLARPHGRP